MTRYRVAFIAFVVAFLAGCDHPIGIITPHAEVGDLVVRDSTGAIVARTVLNRSWEPESLVLRDGRSLRVELEALDFRGVPLDIAGRRGFSFRFEAVRGALLQWEPLGGFGRLHPFAIGETEARFLVWHVDHADFVSPWLRIIVTPPASPSTESSQ